MDRLFLISNDSPFQKIILTDEALPSAKNVVVTPDGKRMIILSPVETAKLIIGQAYASIQYVNAACRALSQTLFDPRPGPGVDPIWYRNIEGLFYSAKMRAQDWRNTLSGEMLYVVPIIVTIYRRIFNEGTNNILGILETYEMSAHISEEDYQKIISQIDKMYQKICINKKDCEAVVPKLWHWFGETKNEGMREISRQLHLLVDKFNMTETDAFAGTDIAEVINTIRARPMFSYAAEELPVSVSNYCNAMQRLVNAVENSKSAAVTVHALSAVIESIVNNVDAAVSKMNDVMTVWQAFSNQIQHVINSLMETSHRDQTVFIYVADTLTIQNEWESLAVYAQNLLDSRQITNTKD